MWQTLLSLWLALSDLTPRKTPPRRPALRRPRLEALEDRTLPAASLNQVFVASLYQGLLNRDTDPAYQGWVNQVDNGTAPVTVVREIQSSAEHRIDQVEGLYRGLLGRSADPGGLNAAVGFLEAGGAVSQMEAAILGSQEFLTDSGGTPTGFLNALYKDVLGRGVDPSGAASWGAALAAGASPAQVAQMVVDSPEAITDEVIGFYNNDLGRPPDSAGLQFWDNQIEHGQSPEVVEADMISSIESIGKLAAFVGNAIKQKFNYTADKAAHAYRNQLGPTAGPGLSVSPQNPVTFKASEGSTTPMTATFTVQNTATRRAFDTLTVSVQAQTEGGGRNWLSVKPTRFTLGAGQSTRVTITANPTGLLSLGGTSRYNGTITVTGSDGKVVPLNVVLQIVPTAQIQGTYSGNYGPTQLEGPNTPPTQVSGTVMVLITSVTPDSNNPGQSIVQGQASVTGLSNQPIASTLSGATFDNQTNTLSLGTISSGGNSVSFEDAKLNGNSFTTSLGPIMLNGDQVGLQASNVTLTKK